MSQWQEYRETLILDLSCECQTPEQWLEEFAKVNQNDDVIALSRRMDNGEKPGVEWWGLLFFPSMRTYDAYVITEWKNGE